MKKLTLAVLVTVLMSTLFAGQALATRWDDFNATADCDGWEMDGLVKIGAANAYVDIEYTVTASADGTLVEEQTGTLRVWLDPYAVPITLNGSWAEPLTGEVTIEGTFFLPYISDGYEATMTFTAVVDCGGGESDFCARRPAWWKRHCNAWPVDGLTIGNCYKTRGQLVGFLHTRANNVQKRLARHLIAAKLNVAAGVDGSEVAVAIAAADRFLATHSLNGCLNHHARREARQLKLELRNFNRQRCGTCHGKALAVDKDDEDEAQDNDDLVTWGELKAQYR